MFPRYFEIPEPISGYDLGDFFWIVDPEGTTNLCTNPSFETNTTGWTAVGGSLARVATWQTRGVYCLEVTPGAGVNDGAYFGPLTLNSAIPFTFALDFQGAANRPYQLYFANTGGAILGTAYKFRATGRKQRVYVRSPILGGIATRFYIAKDNHANVTPFQIDAVQIENKAYPTTYADGDQIGVVVGRTDFYWTGTPHASMSVRESQCGIGGRMYSFKELGFRILSIIGLGLAGLQPRLLPQASGGAFYQDTIITDRQFSIIGQVEGDGLAEVQRKREAFVELLRPDSVTPSQPVSLHYIPTDNCGEPIGDELEILCVPDGDVLPMQLDNRHAERLSLPFRLYLPFTARDDGEVGATLGYQTSLANADRILRRSSSGVWSRVGGASAFNERIRAILRLNDGTYAIGGIFTNAGGIANADYLVHYDPATDTLSAFNATPLLLDVYALELMPNGNVLVGGGFQNAGGDANADFICILNTTTGAFSAVNATPLGNSVTAIKRFSNGDYAIGGLFINAGADANADFLAKINGATLAFSAFNATPLNGQVESIYIDRNDNLYAGGAFTNAGGDANADGALRMAAGTTLFTSIASTPFNSSLYDFVTQRNGQTLLAGTYTTPAAYPYLSKYNGASLAAVDAGVNDQAYSFGLFEDDSVLIGGLFTQAGGLPLFDRMAIWNNSAFVMVDVDLPGVATVRVVSAVRGEIIVGYDTAGTALVSAMTTITNSGSTKAYPRFKFTGPGTVFQLKNWTTGRSLWFNLTLLAGETAVLDFSNPQNVAFTSNLRGNLLGTILRGSSNDFWLAPGQNSISLFIAGSVDGNTAANISWREAFHSLDGAIPVHVLP